MQKKCVTCVCAAGCERKFGGMRSRRSPKLQLFFDICKFLSIFLQFTEFYSVMADGLELCR